jgi:rhomboid family GlyGly-CTERM serine protease
LKARPWLLLSLGLMAGASLAWGLSPAEQAWLAWQPGQAAHQPWRAWTAALLHLSPLHLVGNLAGCALLGLLGLRARLGTAPALAWLAAWPLSQAGLLVQPAIERFVGLSGVLHAGLAVAGLSLLLERRGRERVIGALLLAGLLLKLLLERPLAEPVLREWPGLDIAVAPLAHLSGALAGALCALVALGWRRWRASSGHD